MRVLLCQVGRVLTILLVAAALTALPARADLNPSPNGTITVKLHTITQWTPTFPGGADFEITATDLVPLGDGTGRLMVATLGGVIHLIDADGTMAPAPLLTTSQVGLQLQQEAGMTGITLHPDFANPGTFGYGKLYTITQENNGSGGGVTNPNVDFIVDGERHQDVIREWDLADIVGNAEVNSLPSVQLSDSREILRVDQPGPYHNIYHLTFNRGAQSGTDDYGQLYIAVGDGGDKGGYNRFVEAQNLNTIWGNIIRINPDPTAHDLVRTSRMTGLPAYSISPENPYNGDDNTEGTNHPNAGGGDDSLAEIWASGCRSAYRITSDRLTGDLYYGDVGENTREELNRIEKGANFGWGRYEASLLRDGRLELQGNTTHTPPIFEYSRSFGATIVCGFVYRGSAIPELQGKMVFLDYGNGNTTAKLFYGIVDPNDPDYGKFYTLQLDPEGSQFAGPTGTRPLPDHVFSVGEDSDGELYLIAGEDPRQPVNTPDAYVIKITATPSPYELVYRAANGTLTIDTQDEPMIAYVIDGGPFNEENHAAFMGGSALSLDSQILESSPATPHTGEFNIGPVLPSHLSEGGFHAMITSATYLTAIGQNMKAFELVYIPAPGDTDLDGDIDDFDLISAITNYTGSLAPGTGGKTPANGDTDGDGDVDDFDLINMITGYTGSLSIPKVEAPADRADRLANSGGE